MDLSGGQWQQLALARAMMRRRPLLIFLDEPASALDVATETSLLAAYARARTIAGTAGVIVTHRLAAARAADRIIVLAGGQVVEQGSHDELIAASGAYAAMFAAQARGYRVTRLPGGAGLRYRFLAGTSLPRSGRAGQDAVVWRKRLVWSCRTGRSCVSTRPTATVSSRPDDGSDDVFLHASLLDGELPGQHPARHPGGL